MRKGDVWSLKIKDSEGLHPLVVITAVKNDEIIGIAPLFSGDENATHMDRLIYPYQEWLMGDDWVAIRLKEEIPYSNLRSYLNRLPETIVNELDKALKKEKCTLPKGFLMIESLGDEREEFRKDIVKYLSKMEGLIAKDADILTVTIKWIKNKLEVLSEFAEILALDTPVPVVRGSEKKPTDTISFRFNNSKIEFVLSAVVDINNEYCDIVISEVDADKIIIVLPDQKNEMIKLSNEKWILSGLESLKPDTQYIFEFFKDKKKIAVNVIINMKGA